MAENWHQRLNTNLQNEEYRMDALMELKNHFSSVSRNDAVQDTSQLQLPLLFDCLNNSNNEQVDLACEVLTLCMSNLSVDETTERYLEPLVRALNHPNAAVKLMALKEIERCTVNTDLIKQICDTPSLLIALFECVSEDDLNVASKASDIVATIGKDEMGLTRLLQKTYIEYINQGIKASDIIRFRIYSIVIRIACTNTSALQAMINAGWIDALVDELNATDILLKLNALELLSNLAATPFGRLYIEDQQILRNLSIQLKMDHNQDIMASLLLPGLIRFFGNIAYWDPMSLFNTYPEFSEVLLRIDNFEDNALFEITIDTIGHIGSTEKGKFVFNDYDSKIKDILQYLSVKIINLRNERQVRTLTCFENLLRVPLNCTMPDVMAITEKWFLYICNNTHAQLFVKYARTPFPEIRLVALNCLEAIAEQPWGQDAILKTPGLIEYLLDRTEENTKDAKEVKYLTIKHLSASQSRLLDSFKRDLLLQFVKDGPYHSTMRTEVAIEGNAN